MLRPTYKRTPSQTSKTVDFNNLSFKEMGDLPDVKDIIGIVQVCPFRIPATQPLQCTAQGTLTRRKIQGTARSVSNANAQEEGIYMCVENGRYEEEYESSNSIRFNYINELTFPLTQIIFNVAVSKGSNCPCRLRKVKENIENFFDWLRT